MTLPIGTAEERELIRALRAVHCSPLSNNWPREASKPFALAQQAATALQSRIAEVEALLERVARIEGALHKRMHIYRTKRDAADPLADDTYNRHDAFALVVEAFDIFETESGIRASLTQGGE